MKRSSKDRLLVETPKLLAKKGFKGLSTREIAHNADVNIASISYHFNGKKGLITEIIHRLKVDKIVPVIERLTAMPPTTGNAQNLLSMFLEGLLHLYFENKDLFHVLLIAMEEYNDELSSEISDRFREIHRELALFLKQLKDKDILKNKISPELHAFLILSPIIEFIRSEKMNSTILSKEKSDENFIQNFTQEIVRVTFL